MFLRHWYGSFQAGLELLDRSEMEAFLLFVLMPRMHGGSTPPATPEIRLDNVAFGDSPEAVRLGSGLRLGKRIKRKRKIRS